MKHQLLYVHGGDSFKSKEAFLEHLRTVPLREVEAGGERPRRWPEAMITELLSDFTIFTPNMPNKQNADYLEWKVWLERYLALAGDGVVLVGWSQGGYFLAKYLAENAVSLKIQALLLVAAPAGVINDWGGDNPVWQFDMNKLAAVVREKGIKTFIFHSEDDPVVPFSHAEKYAKALPEAVLVRFSDRGHFLIPEFPELVEAIKGVFSTFPA